MSTAAILAARDWAAEHRHQTPDDRMLQICVAVALHELADMFEDPALQADPSRIPTFIRDRADAIEPDPRPITPGDAR